MLFELFNPEHWPKQQTISEQGFADQNLSFVVPFHTGVNTVTSLVESKKAQLVVIAHDVDPIEVNLSYSISPAVELSVLGTVQYTMWSLAMMSEFLHLNPLCRSKHTSFLTLSRDHKLRLHVLTIFIVNLTILGQMQQLFC